MSASNRIAVASLSVALAACSGGPTSRGTGPALDLGISDGSEAAPFRIVSGPGKDLEIPTMTPAPAAFAVEALADVVLSWTAAADEVISLRDPVGITVTCEASPCVLPLALAGAYDAEVRGPDGELPPIRVRARALPPPTPTVLALGGAAVVLRAAAASADDPRGPIADATIHLEAAGNVHLEVTAVGSTSTDLRELLGLVELEIHGADGSLMLLESASKMRTGTLTAVFDADPGDYVVRVHGGADHAAAVEITAAPLAPATGIRRSVAPVAIAAAAAPRLAVGRDLDLVVAQPVASPSVWIDLPVNSPPTYDLVVTWTPADRWLGIDQPDHQRGCNTPCVLERVSSGGWALSVAPADPPAPVRAHVQLWPVPTSSGLLRVGTAVEVATTASAEGDARGPMAEVELEVDQPGTYEVTARDLDWVPPPDWHGAGKLPTVRVYDRDGQQQSAPFGLLTSGAQIQTGLGRAVVEIDEPGRYIIRLDGVGTGADKSGPRRLRVEATLP